MGKARQHHYVQARYLDGFLQAPDKRLYCYGRGRAKPFAGVPDELAKQRDFYQIPNAPPGTNIESSLESRVETPGLAALRQLVTDRRPLKLEQRIDLARYIAFQEMRVPHNREGNREQLSKSIQHMLRTFEEKGGSTALVQTVALAEGLEVHRDTPFSITRAELEFVANDIKVNPDSFDLEAMIEVANKMTKFYAVMRWTVLFPRPQTAFITSDCPVFRTFKTLGGDDALLRPDCAVNCPLSGRALLVMHHDLKYFEISAKEEATGNPQTLPSTSFRTITDQGVKNFNAKIADYSHLWCFSGVQQPSLAIRMQQPSKRSKPDFFSQGPLSGARWRRDG